MPAGPGAGGAVAHGADGEAQWNGGKPVVPNELPMNTGRPLSDIVLEDRGPYWDDPDPGA